MNSKDRNASMIRWKEFCLCFLKIGAGSYGGSVNYIRRVILDENRWLTEEEFLSCYSMAICMPGSTGINLCVCIGQLLCGTRGAVASAICTLIVPTFVVLALAYGYVGFCRQTDVHQLLAGAAAGSCALIAGTTIYLMRIGINGLREVALALCAFLMINFLHWHISGVMILLIPAGMILLRPALVNPHQEPSAIPVSNHESMLRPVIMQVLLTILLCGLFVLSHSPTLLALESLVPPSVSTVIHHWVVESSAAGSCPVSRASLVERIPSVSENPVRTSAELAEMLLPLSFAGFGGGYTILPCLRNQAVDHFAFVNDDQFVNFFSLSNMTPGPSTMIVALIGYYSCHSWGILASLTGLLVAMFAMFAPSTLIAAFLGGHWFRLRKMALVMIFKKTLLPVAVGILFVSTFVIGHQSLHSPTFFVIFIASTTLYLWKSPNPMLLVFGSGVTALLIKSISCSLFI